MSQVVPVKTYRKAAVERRRLYLDYSCWLEPDEELVDVQTTVVPYTDTNPIVVSNGYPDTEHKRLVMFVAGGVGNTTYTIQTLIRTDAGQIKRDDIGIVVLP
jgi:hypothetical protein